ncbi:MazG nucleotide pyrophosphohydrolase domain-containing protein [Arthrobacter sp. N199823]|uniref:MazG nucleotide pyrophosphohydrolase domain-containing protein n=1 Tax=Arthrobacter sp. N199823 TaxID=2058895 RepID=UPI00280071DE|nr:MazG nucleotide pyrophosphohydrolase domain-containing protein [Arthrobacter sp. N199823]
MTANSVPEINGRASSTTVELARLVDVVGALREHCPWTAALTHESLISYLVEESHEFIEALETGSSAQISGELGDILLQVVLHARLAQEAGEFDLADVARGLSEKMIRRSPHVFHPDGTLQESFPATLAEIEETWERVKAQERAGGDSAEAGSGSAYVSGGAAGPFAGIPRTLPALAMAQKSVERARRAGFDVQEPEGILPSPIESEEELGKVLFDVVRGAHERGLDAERALRLAVQNFQALHGR